MHHAARDVLEEPYHAWGGIGVVPSAYNARAAERDVRVANRATARGAYRRGGGDVFAARDGTVFRRTGGDWQRYDRSGWQTTASAPPERVGGAASYW